MYYKINEIECKLIKAEATNTRQMGVVGLVAYWEGKSGESVVQIFHLDYESYGIDGYHLYIDGLAKEIETTIKGVTGGLGGSFVPVSFDEMVFLVKSAYVVDETSLDYLVDFEGFMESFDRLYTALDIEAEIALYEKLFPEAVSEQEFVNYFMMRLMGCDYPSTLMFWDREAFDDTLEMIHEPSALLKNTLYLVHEQEAVAVYRSESLVDYDDKYQLIVSEVKLDRLKMKVLSAAVIETLMVSSIEASFNLNKPEHMMVLSVEDVFFERRFSDMNPELMRMEYYNGILYTEYNTDNRHVGANPYYLNGDLYAMYFFTRLGQLVVVSFDPAHLEEISDQFDEGDAYDKSLKFICDIRTDYPVFYSFVNSSYDNFFDYLEGFGR